jgi:uncharacterized protein involved in outer membrane biogenesis
MSIGTAQPFALQGSMSLTEAKPAYEAKAQLAGTLERIDVRGDASAGDAVATANAVLTPFGSGPIEHLSLEARNVDPHYLRAAAPSAKLKVQLTADRPADGERMHGALSIVNAQPGTLDANKLPIAQLSGKIEGKPADVVLSDLLLDLGRAGKVSGRGRLRGSKLDLDLVARNVDMEKLHQRLYPTQLAGTLRARATQEHQRFALALTQKDGRIDLDAELHDRRLTVERLRATAAGGGLSAHGSVGFEGDKPLAFNGTLTNFDPSRFGRFTPARINSRFDARGALAPVLQLKADLDVFDSQLSGMATAGKIRWRSKGTHTPDIEVDLVADVGDTHAQAKGTLFDPMHLGNLDIKLALAGSDLAHLYPILRIPLPPTPEYALTGHLVNRDDVWTFKQFKGKVGQSDLSGDFTLDRSRARQMLRAELVSDTLRLEDLGGFIGAGKQPVKHAKGQQVLPNEPFKLDKIRAADADVQFTGRRIVTGGLPLHRMTAHLRVAQGVLTVDPLDFRLAHGSIVGKVAMDANQPVIRGTVNLRADEVRVARLLPKTQTTKASVGTIEGRAELTGTGNSIAAMLGTADGHVTLVMDGGEISDLVLRLLNLDIANATVTLLRGDQTIPVRCMVGQFVAKDGHLKPAPFILDTEHTKVAMDGDIDLGAETLNLRLTAQPKDVSLAALRGPVVIKGPFTSPSVRPDLRRAIVRSVAAITLGIVATPLAALVPLFEWGTEKDANCPAIVAQAKALIDQAPVARAPESLKPKPNAETQRGAETAEKTKNEKEDGSM